jgi:lipoprotein NlpD
VLGEQGQPSGGFGLRLAVLPGEVVRAAADGRVAYVGAGLRSYGQLVIIKHPAGWLSAYGYNRVPRVKEGDVVQHGQVVAEAGEGPLPEGGMAPQLYFEIRRLGRAVDPRPLLPAR